MGGEVIQFDPDLDRGEALGEDEHRYAFAGGQWRSPGRPERGDAVRFVVAGDRASEIYRLQPAQVPRLTPLEAIGAVYSIALDRAGGTDPFGAPTSWRNFVVPSLILVAFGCGELLAQGPRIDWSRLTPSLGLLLVAVLVLVLLVMIGLLAGVVALLGWLVGGRRRIGCGVLAYLWMEAVLLQPAILLMRLILGPHDPTIVIVLLALGTIVAVIGAGRVVKAGFQLGNIGLGIFIVIAASTVRFILDRVVG